MDFDALRAFVAVAEGESFSLAAERLHLTQPAVSKRIALLEGQLDTRLFDRIGRTVSLTEAGRILFGRATAILTDVEDTRRAINSLGSEVSGALAVATSHHIGLWRLPPLLKAFTLGYPEVTPDLHFMDSEVAHNEIVQGHMELGIITLAPQQPERLTAIPLWTDTLCFVSAPDHPLAQRQHLTIAHLAESPAIMPDLSTFTGRIVRDCFVAAGCSLNIEMTTNYLETIRMLIGVGLGWSVLPESMLDNSIRRLPVEGNLMSRQLGIIHHRGRTLSNAARAFINLALGHAEPGLNTTAPR